MTWIYRNEFGNPVFVKTPLRQSTGFVWRAGKKPKDLCTRLFPHTFDGRECTACQRIADANKGLSAAACKLVHAFLGWVEFKFGNR